MKVVLINPRFGLPGKETAITQPVFPYALGHIARSLLDHGHDVEVLDVYAHEWSPQEVEERLKKLSVDWIGITAMSTQYAYVKWLVQAIRTHCDARIVLGGALATHSYHVVLRNMDVDVCVVGDGVRTILDVVDPDRERSSIGGIAFLTNDGSVVYTGPGKYIKKLDELPLPPYELFPMELYTRAKLFGQDSTGKNVWTNVSSKRLRAMVVLTAWGCPFRCHFCSRSTIRFRLKSVDRVIEEVRYLIDHFGVEAIHFGDELLFANKKRAKEMSLQMRQLGIPWDGQARVNTINEDILRLAKDCGCTGIGLGIESGSNRILAAMNKGITVEQSEAALRAAKKVGMFVKIQLIMGYPGETRETVYETVDLFKRVGHPGRRLALILPLPGSELYNRCIADGLIQDEDEYLTKIHAGYGGNVYFFNLMDMPNNEVVSLMREAEDAMDSNYAWYLFKKFRWEEFLDFVSRTRSRRFVFRVFRRLSRAARKLGLRSPKRLEFEETVSLSKTDGRQ